MKDSFESLFTVEAIKHEYSILCQRKFDYLKSVPNIQSGHDGIDYHAFEANQEQRIRTISRKVISTDKAECRYTFSPFLEHEIPKPDSTSTRTISIGTISDTLVQQAISRHLEPHVEKLLPHQVYAYRKGKSARQAARHVYKSVASGNRFVFEADIVKFFDKINRSILIDMMESLPIDVRAKTLIRRFLHSKRVLHEHVKSKTTTAKYQSTFREAGVPQGGVLSGMLSNLYLSKLDAVLGSFPGYARYADDFLVCCSTREEAKLAESLAQATLECLRLQLHPDKSFITDVAETKPIKFLGFSICPSEIRIHPKNIEKFKASICEVINSQIFFENADSNIRRLLRRLRYKVCGPESDELRNTYSGLNNPLLYRRCWIGYFRCATDLQQIKHLDKFILARVSYFAYSRYGIRLNRRQIREWGLPSLVSTYYKSRRGIPVQT